ncbi:MAG TPA: hypothetical protein PLN21_08625 [Gemmatales bacterium]|nr:hypothetical protein [Gemmatales bacterium]
MDMASPDEVTYFLPRFAGAGNGEGTLCRRKDRHLRRPLTMMKPVIAA